MGSRIVFTVMDYDTIADEVVGSICIDAKNYIDPRICNVPMNGEKMCTRVAEGEDFLDGEDK